MASPEYPAALPVVIASLLVSWRIVSRLRRSIGRQKLRLFRSRLAAWMFPFALLALLASAMRHPWTALAESVGVVLGVLLARHALGRTKFEVAAGGHCYTPDPYIGTAITLAFMARIGYRLVHAYDTSEGFTMLPGEIVKGPLTLLLVGLLLGYHACFAWGLLSWYRQGRASGPGIAPPGRG